jgi:hypothetical protein
MSDASFHFAGYAYGLILAAIPIHFISRRMWQMIQDESLRHPAPAQRNYIRIPDTFVRFEWQTIAVGITERALYIASLQLARPEFIAIWLTLKTVARSRRWTSDETIPGRAIYNNFLVGNALSIGFALISSAAIDWAAGPSWNRNITLAWLVPLVAFVGSWLLFAFLWICHGRIRAANTRLGIPARR